MILEVAVLDIKPGREIEFESAFETAQKIIAGMDGYVSHQLKKCIEDPNRYLLTVDWETLEHHTAGFRGSAEYQEWRALLHQFYDPFPKVQHYESI